MDSEVVVTVRVNVNDKIVTLVRLCIEDKLNYISSNVFI